MVEDLIDLTGDQGEPGYPQDNEYISKGLTCIKESSNEYSKSKSKEHLH